MSALCAMRKNQSLAIPFVALRGLHTTSAAHARPIPKKHIGVGRFRISKDRSIPLTYDEAKASFRIGEEKSWNTWNTSNLKDEGRQSRTVTEDQFIRNFIDGTWHNKQATDIVIKRRHNMIAIFMYILAPRDLQPVYFLTGYTEELLSCLLKCPVKLELQSLNKASDLTFKMI